MAIKLAPPGAVQTCYTVAKKHQLSTLAADILGLASDG
jgi:hypothetical protein